MDLSKQLSIAIKASLRAGMEIVKIYQEDFEVELKDDRSPLTAADKKSNQVIFSYLKMTDHPIISEEIRNMEYAERKNWDTCWIVDPLDGTKEFVKKNGEFTVNIALIREKKPILGVVYVPVQKLLFFAAENIGSYMISLNEFQGAPSLNELIEKGTKLDREKSLPTVFTIVVSRSHMSPETEDFVNQCREKHGEIELISCGSSLKICRIAERQAHVYPRLAPTMEWDTAAAHAIAKFSDCEMIHPGAETELVYNKKDLLNPFFVVREKE